MIILHSKTYNDFALIEIEIEGGVCEPSDLTKLEFPQYNHTKGIILSGRAPVWLFATLVHEFHPTLWVATFDPRLGGGVIVQSHSKKYKIGDIILIK